MTTKVNVVAFSAKKDYTINTLMNELLRRSGSLLKGFDS